MGSVQLDHGVCDDLRQARRKTATGSLAHVMSPACELGKVADQRFLDLLWKFIKAGCVDRGLFRAASEGLPQGGVITPLHKR
jgi:hypothetical protein